MKKIFVKIGLLLFILVNMMLISCRENETEYVTELSFNSKEFNENKAKWENKKPLNYQFDYEVDMGALGPVTVYVTSVVKNGVHDSFSYTIGENKRPLEERPAAEETLTEEELFEEGWYATFLREVYHLLDVFKFETIDDYITDLEERIVKLNSVDFEEEKYTKYELTVFYNSDYYFPYKSHLDYASEKEYILMDGDYNGIYGGISNFKVLNK